MRILFFLFLFASNASAMSGLPFQFSVERAEKLPEMLGENQALDQLVLEEAENFTARWDGFTSALKTKNNLISQRVDWELYGDLNFKAARIWNALLECHDQNLVNARNAIFFRKTLCPESPERAAELDGEMRSLHQNVRDLFRTTQFFREESGEAVYRYEYVEAVKASRAFIKANLPVHPLFAQAVQNVLATLAKFSQYPYSSFVQGNSRMISQMYDLGMKTHDGFVDYWLEPSYIFSFDERFGKLVDGKSKEKFDEQTTMRAIGNAVRLLDLMFPHRQSGDCKKVPGIWPVLNNRLHEVFTYQDMTPYSLNWEMLGGFRGIQCGRMPNPAASIDEINENMSIDATIVETIRKVSAAYGIETDRRKTCVFSTGAMHIACGSLDPAKPEAGW